MRASEYVLGVLAEFPDNEMTATDLLTWQGPDRRFGRTTIYDALNELLELGKVVRFQDPDSQRTYWAIAASTDAG